MSESKPPKNKPLRARGGHWKQKSEDFILEHRWLFRGLGDALDRAGVMFIVLSVLGGFFYDKPLIEWFASTVGVILGLLCLIIGICAKHYFPTEKEVNDYE